MERNNLHKFKLLKTYHMILRYPYDKLNEVILLQNKFYFDRGITFSLTINKIRGNLEIFITRIITQIHDKM